MNPRITFLTIVAMLAVLVAPSQAQIIPFRGCEVLGGTGEGQFLGPLGEGGALLDQGVIQVQSYTNGDSFDFSYNGVSFPPVSVSPEGEATFTGFANWNMRSKGVWGSNRFRGTLTYDDPLNPTTMFFVLEGDVLRGNRYRNGGSYVQGATDLATGHYTVSVFYAVFCPDAPGGGN